MGNDGLSRAGYKQISNVVQAIFIGPSDGAKTTYKSSDYNKSGWAKIVVISSKAVFKAITAPGIDRSSVVTSATSYLQGAEISGNGITRIALSTQTTGHLVQAFDKILL